MRILLCYAVASLSLFPAAVRANDRDAAERMLAAYEQTVARVNSFRIECVAKEWDNGALQGDPGNNAGDFSRVEETTVFHDALRWRIATVKRRTPKPSDRVQFASLSGTEYRFDEFLDARQGLHVQWASFDANEPPKFDHLAVRLMGAGKRDEHGRYLGWTDIPFGLMPCDARQPVWTVMREAPALDVLPEVKVVAGRKTQVVRSKGKFGTHTLCLDPEFGFLPREIVIQKQNGDLFNSIQLGVEQNPSARIPEAAKSRVRARGMTPPNYTITESETRIDNIQIEERDGQFVMTAFDHRQEQSVKKADQTERVKSRAEYRTRVFDLQPDSWPASAFRTSVEIPNGTRVNSESGQSHVWMNGTVE